MTRFIWTPLAAVFTCLAVGVVPASAQYAFPFRPPQYGPYYQTQLSPYLNMLRVGDPAANYFIGVEPEVQRRQDRNAMYGSIQSLGNQLPLPPGLTDRDIDLPLTSTGHPTAFGYTGMYFVGNNNMPTRPVTNPFSQQRGMQAGGRGMGMGMPGMGMGGMGQGGMWPRYNTQGMGGGMMR